MKDRNKRILDEVYMEIGSPIELDHNATAWRKIALEAMRRLECEIEDERKPNIHMVNTDGVRLKYPTIKL